MPQFARRDAHHAKSEEGEVSEFFLIGTLQSPKSTQCCHCSMHRCIQSKPLQAHTRRLRLRQRQEVRTECMKSGAAGVMQLAKTCQYLLLRLDS